MIIKLSIQNLAEYCTLRGSLGKAMPGNERLLLGTAVHKKLQSEYEKNFDYKREVSMSVDVERAEYTLAISGRADGVYVNDGVWIHEIKSTCLECSSIERPVSDSHVAQMMIYAHIYCSDHDLTSISTRLTYYSLADHHSCDFDYNFTAETLSVAFNEYVEDYCRLQDVLTSARINLEASIKELPFPFDNFRKNQREGAAQVFTAIRNNATLFLQAPTGTGKTLMVLFPAVKCLENNEHIFYLCAKSQTKESAIKAIEKLRGSGLKIKSVVITAKDRCCLMPPVNCDPERCPYSRDFFDKIHIALPQIIKNDDFPDVNKYAEQYQICPHELSLALAEYSHCIICDYNYVFEPMVHLKRFSDISENCILLIDEAHNLISRSREMFSAEIDKNKVLQYRKRTRNNLPLYRAFTRLNSELLHTIKLAEPDPCLFDYSPILKLMEYADTADTETQKFIKELYRFFVISDYYDPEIYNCYFEEKTLKLSCLNPSSFLTEIEKNYAATVFFSATLSPYCYFAPLLSCDTNAYGYSAPYPFDKKNLLVCADYSVETKFSRRIQFLSDVAQKIALCRKYSSGNILVFFPSFSFLNAVLEKFDGEVLVHKPDFSFEQREEFLQAINTQNHTLAFSVMGSHFSEGLDIGNLCGIIIVGLPMPQFCREQEDLQNYFEKTMNNGFDYAYVYPAINKVMQAGGRLIRGENDKGFILLLESRFKKYARLLPEFWQVNELKYKEDYTIFEKFHQ